MRWWTADLHLGHTNIIGYTGRPFAETAEMDEWLVDAWNDAVAPGERRGADRHARRRAG